MNIKNNVHTHDNTNDVNALWHTRVVTQNVISR